jgi:hypothetical protein
MVIQNPDIFGQEEASVSNPQFCAGKPQLTRNSTICQCGPLQAGVNFVVVDKERMPSPAGEGPPIRHGSGASETSSVCLSAFKLGPRSEAKNDPLGIGLCR